MPKTNKEVRYQKAAQNVREATDTLDEIDERDFLHYLIILLLHVVEELLSDSENQGRRTGDESNDPSP